MNIVKYLVIIIIIFFSFYQKVCSEEFLSEYLVTKPHMPDLRFKETVIVILYHNQEGAAGLVINKPIKKMPIRNLFEGTNLSLPPNSIKKDVTLYWGGPVNPRNIYLIHSNDYKNNDFIYSNQELTVTHSSKILLDIANNNGPEKYFILSGIAIWSPGQLDHEIQNGDWEKKLINYELFFKSEKSIWNRLILSQDI